MHAPDRACKQSAASTERPVPCSSSLAQGLTSGALQEALQKVDVRREEVRRPTRRHRPEPPLPSKLACRQPGPLPHLRAEPHTTSHPRPGQVLLTLYATVAERYAGDEEGDEEGTGAAEGGAARPAAAAAGPTTEELEAAAAFSSSLAALAAEEEAAGQGGGAISQLAALAAQHAAVLQAMHETAQLAASVRVAAELQQRLADFDAAYAAGSYSEAAWIAVELQKGVAAVPGGQQMGVVQRELQAVLVP